MRGNPLASASRGRRAVVDVRARADDDGPSTGGNVAGVDAGGLACVGTVFDRGLDDLSMGCGRPGAFERETDGGMRSIESSLFARAQMMLRV